MTVQHVRVAEGGQAIVGNVNATPEGVGSRMHWPMHQTLRCHATLGLGEGMASANSYLQFTKAKQLYCGPLALTNAQLFEALSGFVAKHPDAGQLKMGNALLLSLQDLRAYPCP